MSHDPTADAALSDADDQLIQQFESYLVADADTRKAQSDIASAEMAKSAAVKRRTDAWDTFKASMKARGITFLAALTCGLVLGGCRDEIASPKLHQKPLAKSPALQTAEEINHLRAEQARQADQLHADLAEIVLAVEQLRADVTKIAIAGAVASHHRDPLLAEIAADVKAGLDKPGCTCRNPEALPPPTKIVPPAKKPANKCGGKKTASRDVLAIALAATNSPPPAIYHNPGWRYWTPIRNLLENAAPLRRSLNLFRDPRVLEYERQYWRDQQRRYQTGAAIADSDSLASDLPCCGGQTGFHPAPTRQIA